MNSHDIDGVGRRTVGDDEEEERYNDILLMMELLTNLLSKDFMDFSDPGMYMYSSPMI